MTAILKDTAYWEELRRLEWERVKREGVRFDEPLAGGYFHEGKRKYDRKVIADRKATDFSLPNCNCAIPPWEDCEHTA
jgi:hypothetical protein